jgi:hypothetical protein
MSDLARFLREMQSDDNETEAMLPLKAEAQAGQLRESFAALAKKHQFLVGDLVQWKAGLKNKKSPAYDQPIIVTEVLSQAIIDSKDESGSPYFREPLDIKAGEIKDGDFLEYYMDSRRFEPYSGPGK